MKYKFSDVNYILEKANVAEEPGRPLDLYNAAEINKATISYYQRNTEIPLSKYRITKDEKEKIIETSLYEDSDINIKNLMKVEEFFSDYSKEALKVTGLESNDFWNGNAIAIRNTGDGIQYFETDYYTSRVSSRLLFLEMSNALMNKNGDYSNINSDDVPLRKSILNKREHFSKQTYHTPGASSGGVVIGDVHNSLRILLARRSKDLNINAGLVSIIPNGGVEYNDLERDGFEETLRREFYEELLPSEEFNFDKDVRNQTTSVGWNARDGGLSVMYTLFLDSNAYEDIRQMDSTNFEFSEFVEIDVQDYEKVINTVNTDTMSSSTISVVCESIRQIDEKPEYPDLPYSVENISE
jgi:hypothetical protein